jgi:hypothetical protein
VLKTEREVVDGVKRCVIWWVGKRRQKLEDQLSDTMSINPFLMPFLFNYHNISNLEGLADLIIASHLMTGHNTGFGKLIDEKILPRVFDAEKLDAQFRRTTPLFSHSCFDEIDHRVVRSDGTTELLSLKAGKWTIQLTMAVQLNVAFNEILTSYATSCDSIVVGVFYGKKGDLTDKYEILRGINRGANHDVVDLTNDVSVYSGKSFWSWLNDGEDLTQEWVMAGIIEALEEADIKNTAQKLLNDFRKNVVTKHQNNITDNNGNLDWKKFLKSING